MADARSIIPWFLRRRLSAKGYAKREKAATELERIVRQLVADADHEKITAVIEFLVLEYTYSPHPNHRKGGLTALAAVTVALNLNASEHRKYFGATRFQLYFGEQIVFPVLNSLSDHDSKVRYHSCEALYNIAKVVRGDVIVFLNDIFVALCELTSDSDADVQSAANLLDRLVKDVVTESDQFSMETFIPVLRERMNSLKPHVRQFSVGWITVLFCAPQIDVLSFLPDFLDGLLNMLSDSNNEIRQQADSALSEFLQEIRTSPSVDFSCMVEILVQRTTSLDEFTRLTAITWLLEFIRLAGNLLAPYFADVLGAILTCISDKEEKIRVVAQETNVELRSVAEGFDVGSMLSVAMRNLSSDSEAARIESLHWISMLLTKSRREVLGFLSDILDVLLRALSDPSDEVVLLVVDVHAAIASEPVHFHQLLVSLVHTFRADISLLERRGSLLIRRVCMLQQSERVYRELSPILEGETDLDFAATMIQALNLTLLTSSELSDLRNLLKQSLVNGAGEDLFLSLYASWCHSPVAIISLCFLAQAYQHASSVIRSLVGEDFNVKFWVQMNKLINVLETPAFAYLRLQLLDPEKCKWLVKALNDLLVLLPQQTDAYKILCSRLRSVLPFHFYNDPSKKISSKAYYSHVDHVGSVQILEDGESVYDSWDGDKRINFSSRLQQFLQMQQQHRKFAKLQAMGKYKGEKNP